jgi:ABC-type ATPase with predicted acetyltransferase domain
MPIYNLSKTFRRKAEFTEKAAAVLRMFGLTAHHLAQNSPTCRCRLRITSGDVVYITGPSGCGKSLLLSQLQKRIPPKDRLNLNEIKLPRDKAVIDCFRADLTKALRLLNTAGLSDVFCLLNHPANLSDGQKYRFRLAAALAARKNFIFADEFCSCLDRITASVIAYNVRIFATQYNITFILAASARDIMADLSPDVLVINELSGPAQVIYNKKRTRT